MEQRNQVSPTVASFWYFFAKTAAVLFLFAVFLYEVTPDLSGAGDEAMSSVSIVSKLVKNERVRLYALGLIQNPAALYKASEVAEREGSMDVATRDMQLAIGLLELHNADKQVLKRYINRLEKIQAVAVEQKK
jgi:hypothetical protein